MMKTIKLFPEKIKLFTSLAYIEIHVSIQYCVSMRATTVTITAILACSLSSHGSSFEVHFMMQHPSDVNLQRAAPLLLLDQRE
jgi:hypothetical protein